MPDRRVVLYQPSYQPPGSAMKAIAPLALLHLASATQAAGYETQIVDAQVEPEALTRLRELTRDALAVGITSMTGYQIQGALAAAEAVRDANPATPIIWGGWHASLRQEETAQDPLVDVVVRGPGEQTLVELLNCYANGRPCDQVPGIAYRRGGQIVTTPDRSIEKPDPHRRLPFEKLRMEAYGGRILFGDDWGANFSPSEGQPFPYTSSNGCTYRCRFCAATKVYKRRWLALPVEKTLDELDFLHRQHGIQVFSFYDPEFFIDAQRAAGIMQGILDRGLRIFWKAQVRPEHIVRLGLERMRLAYQSGCRQLEIGAESGSPAILEMIQKDSTPEAALESAAILRQTGIAGQYNLIFGFPRETDAHRAETMRFVAELKRINPDCLIPMYHFVPHPGVPLEDEAREHGFVPPTTLREWASFDCGYTEPHMPWIRSPQALKDRAVRVIAFYLPLAFPGDVTRGTLKHVRSRMRRWPEALWMWPAHCLARARVALDWYGWPWEWRLFNFVRDMLSRRPPDTATHMAATAAPPPNAGRQPVCRDNAPIRASKPGLGDPAVGPARCNRL
jgi:anaerobic magnesium-protoporphyrin IX monomethyl ester cyclase